MERKVEVERIIERKERIVETVAVDDPLAVDPLAALQDGCHHWHSTIVWSSLVALLVLSKYLYQWDIPSCTVPGSIIVFWLMNKLLPDLWSSIMVFLMVCLCTGLMVANKTQVIPNNNTIWKFVSPEMLIWADYMLLARLFYGIYYPHYGPLSKFILSICLTFVPAVINALVLKHPVFEMFGVPIFGICSITNVPLLWSYSIVDHLVPVVYLNLSIGCSIMGRCCRHYHLHVTGYCRPHLSEEDGPEATVEDPEEEKKDPTSPSLVNQVKSWCIHFQYPLLISLGNIFSFYLVVHVILRIPPMNWDWDSTEEVRVETLKFNFLVGFATLFLTFLVDAYFCARGFQYIEGLIAQYQETEPFQSTTETESTTASTTTVDDGAPGNTKQDSDAKQFYFVAFSRWVDSLFGCLRMPKESNSTFLIGLLYALFSLAVWGATISSSSIIFLQVTKDVNSVLSCYTFGYDEYIIDRGSDSFSDRGSNDDDYFAVLTISSLQHDANFTRLPLQVQSWIKSDCRDVAQTLPYARVLDGSFVFSYVREQKQNWTEKGVAVVPSDGSETIEYTPTDSTSYDTTEWEDDSYESRSYNRRMYDEKAPFDLLAIPNTEPHHGWCGVSSTRKCHMVIEEVLCYSSEGNTTHRFAQVVDEIDSRYFDSCSYHELLLMHNRGDPRYYVTKDALWVAHRLLAKDHRNKTYHKKDIVSVVSYNISTMKRKLEVGGVIERKRKKVETVDVDPYYSRWHSTVVWSSLVVLLVLSKYSYQWDIPSCTVPGSIIFFLLTNQLLPDWWPSVMVFFMVCLCTGLMVAKTTQVLPNNNTIWKFVSLEMLIWAHYTLLACSLFVWLFYVVREVRNYPYYLCGHPFKFILPLHLILVPAVINALVLNHPVFEMFGVPLFGISSIASLHLLWCHNCTLMFRSVPVACLILTIGCHIIGRCCRHYHVHVIVYCRRGWRQVKKVVKLKR